MKTTTSIILILTAVNCLAVDDRFLDAVATVESSRNPAAVGDNGKANGEFQLHAPAWEQVSAMRKAAGKPTYPYSFATDRAVGREYAKDYLTWIESNLAKRLGRKPAPWEVYASYNRGLAGFAKIGYSFDNLPPHTRRACSRISSLLTLDSTKMR